MMLRVVIADDHPAFALGVRYGLEARGIDVVGVAHDGDRVIDLVRALTPDAVVLDVRMPGQGGLEACRSITEHGLAPAVVILSTYDDAATRGEAHRAGARAYLTKETPIDELAQVLERLVAEQTLNLIVPPVLPTLTEREREVLRLLALGLSNKAIAERLQVSPETVKDHCSSLFGKLAVRDRTTAVLEAQRLGLVR